MLIFTVIACDAEVINTDPTRQPTTLPVDIAAPTYSEHIAPLLETYCVDCHAHNGVMYAGVELDTYAAARSVRVRNTCTAISPQLVDEFGDWLIPQDGHSGLSACAPWEAFSMPPGAMGRLTPDQQRMLAIWVANGAPE
jgi:hypothetical protein